MGFGMKKRLPSSYMFCLHGGRHGGRGRSFVLSMLSEHRNTHFFHTHADAFLRTNRELENAVDRENKRATGIKPRPKKK